MESEDERKGICFQCMYFRKGYSEVKGYSGTKNLNWMVECMWQMQKVQIKIVVSLVTVTVHGYLTNVQGTATSK